MKMSVLILLRLAFIVKQLSFVFVDGLWFWLLGCLFWFCDRSEEALRPIDDDINVAVSNNVFIQFYMKFWPL